MGNVIKFKSKEMFRKLEQAKSFRPLHDWILICREDADEKSTGGIYIPESATSKRMLGVVAGISNKHLPKSEFKFSIGDRVIFAPQSGIEIKIFNDEYFIIKANELLAVV